MAARAFGGHGTFLPAFNLPDADRQVPAAGCKTPALPRPNGGMLTYTFSQLPGDAAYVSCQMPTEPLVLTDLLKAFHAGRCAASQFLA